MLKQVIIIRSDLKMGKGKLAAEAAHASIAAFLKAGEEDRREWIEGGMKKIVLKVESEKELISAFNALKKEKLPVELIADRGLTQISPGTKTAVGCGPIEEKKIDKITGKMKLL
ncbi:MAG: peptidyl-tRNA hydrolase Pth2 [Candidatus Aenigmatarchaeota archaeon]